jgi:DNA uptake protein ComE-like DNA-binding protein
MKKLWILLFTIILGVTLSVAQTKKATDEKASTTKTEKAEKAKSSGLDKGETAAGKIDVNSASQDELEKLNGIGPVTAKKIVDGRPYKTKRDLLNKKVVSQGEYDKIKDNIIAHQTGGEMSAKADKTTKATTTKKK